MVRIIDADALIEFIVEEAQDLRTLSTKTVGQAISKTPTVDAVPVMHGEWLDRDGGYQFGTCSVCGDRWGSISVMKYCPSCGAKMDGEREGE